jgi:hypothetical protein
MDRALGHAERPALLGGHAHVPVRISTALSLSAQGNMTVALA